ncbi:TonB-dependent receptor [Sphingobacterium spiritivorum]|uniref:TonB-dependent receptor n=1 Tax=Sphingobacterium spiritivorum TaxID=258 RepID=UPI003DA64ED0
MKYFISFILIMMSVAGNTQLAQAQKKGIFTGVILDESRHPVSRASVILEPDHIVVSADEKGVFRFNKLFQGIYQYSISAIGFVTDTGSVYIEGTGSEQREFVLRKSNKILDEVAITQTNKARPTLIDPANAAMPVTVIDRKTIELMGSRRLDEILKEQTGIAIVNNTSGGARSVGVQMQGFSSQYIMILIDGQPMLGRNSGNFDLSRISVANIERIEIIKGASSCLYGSDALGGAINIITRLGAITPQLHASLNYGSFQILDATLEGETSFNNGKGSALVSANYYHTNGFNNNKQYMEGGTSVPPYTNMAVQGKVRHQVGSDQQHIGWNARLNTRSSDMTRVYSQDYATEDRQREHDFNTSVYFDKRFNEQWKSLSTYYFSYYKSDINVRTQQQQATLTNDKFSQYIHRLEQQVAYSSETFNATFGAGFNQEHMEAVNNFAARSQNSYFAYSQGNKELLEQLRLTAGLRYDYTEGFGGKLSPSLGLQYTVIPQLILKTGIGSGFKAPDFKSRYQVFYNPAANYYVIGNEVLRETLTKMEEAGEISEIRKYVVNQLDRNLQAEKNTSFNAGFTWQISKQYTVEGSYFHHQLKNQINSIQVATGTRNMAVYSYQNLPESVNKGFDVTVTAQPAEHLTVNAGYQYLIAKDLSVEDSIRAGNWPYNQNIHDPATGNSYAPTAKDYWGLENRSRHQFNLGLMYTFKPWNLTLNLRANFRGRYPFGDANGNQFIDRYDVFVNDHILYNATLEKKFDKLPLTIRLNGENLSNYINYLIPGQVGRTLIAGVSYRLIKH